MSNPHLLPKKSIGPLALSIHLMCISAIVSLASIANAQTNSAAANQLIINKIEFKISAGSLTTALNEFAAQSGLLISGNSELAQGKNSKGLIGNYSPQDALSQLLSATGLSYHVTEGKKITLEKKRESGVLQTVKVSAAILESTTEGSESYTTGAMNSATKLDLSIRQTPQSITVMTRQRMDDEGIVTMLDVVEKAPGLSVNSYGTGRPLFYARGFSLDTIIEDGIPGTFSSYIPSPLSNLAMYDRVEIVRGSTGLTQGVGNPSAAINLIRKRPTEEFQAAISVAAGSWNDFSTTGDVSGAISDDGNIRGRAVAYLQDGDNFRDVEKEDTQMLYGTIDMDLSENTTLNLGYSYLNTFSNLVWGGIPVSATGEHLHVSRSTFVGADWEHLNQDAKTVYASVDHQFDNSWSIRLNTKYSNIVSDVLGTWLMPEGDSRYSHIYWAAKNDTDQFGAELYATGLVPLLGRDHELVLGVSHTKEDLDNKEFFNCFNPSCGVSTGFDVFNPDNHTPIKPILSDDSPDKSESPSKLQQQSAYGTVRWNLADTLKLITGVRLDWYDNKTPWSTTKEVANFSRYGGLVYDFQKNHSAYLSYSEIFKPQDSVDIHRNVLQPIVGKNYELGVKGEYFDGLLNANIALFRIDQANRAKRLIDQSDCPTFPNMSCFEASGLIRSKGIEAEIQGELAHGWEIGAGYTYSNIEYLKDSDAEKGQRVNTGIPERLFKINTTYRLPGELNKWRIGGGASYQSDIYYKLDNGTEIVRNQQKSYVLANLMVAYKASEHLSLQANANNIFDKTYYKAIADDIYYGAVEMYGEPRNFTLSAEYKF